MHHVSVGVCVLVCHANFFKTTTATDFYCKLIVIMNFQALENFFFFLWSYA